MNHLDPLISDLALILMLAGITTLLFKWMKQPVVWQDRIFHFSLL